MEKIENKKDYNYFKLLEDIKQCYELNVPSLEIPFSIAKDYPNDLCYKLQSIKLQVDFTPNSILVVLPLKKD